MHGILARYSSNIITKTVESWLKLSFVIGSSGFSESHTAWLFRPARDWEQAMHHCMHWSNTSSRFQFSSASLFEIGAQNGPKASTRIFKFKIMRMKIFGNFDVKFCDRLSLVAFNNSYLNYFDFLCILAPTWFSVLIQMQNLFSLRFYFLHDFTISFISLHKNKYIHLLTFNIEEWKNNSENSTTRFQIYSLLRSIMKISWILV